MHSNILVIPTLKMSYYCSSVIIISCSVIKVYGSSGGRCPYQIKLQRYLCQSTPLFMLFSVTRTKLAVDMWKKSTMGNNRFHHMLVVVYHSLVPSLF